MVCLILATILLLAQSQILTTQPVNSVQPASVGGYSLVQNPSGSIYTYALSLVLAEHPNLSLPQLILVQQQVVAGINYRFTFRVNGVTSQYVIFVPLNYQSSSPTSTTAATNGPALPAPQISAVAGYTNAQITSLVGQIIASTPSLQNYTLNNASSSSRTCNGASIQQLKLTLANGSQTVSFYQYTCNNISWVSSYQS